MINIEICKVRFILKMRSKFNSHRQQRHCLANIYRIVTLIMKATQVLTSQFGSMKNAHSKSDISWSLIDSIPKIGFKLNNSLKTSACLVCQKMTTLHQLQTIQHRTGFLMECWTGSILQRHLKKNIENFSYAQKGWSAQVKAVEIPSFINSFICFTGYSDTHLYIELIMRRRELKKDFSKKRHFIEWSKLGAWLLLNNSIMFGLSIIYMEPSTIIHITGECELKLVLEWFRYHKE